MLYLYLTLFNIKVSQFLSLLREEALLDEFITQDTTLIT
jgi:hypothetical protein